MTREPIVVTDDLMAVQAIQKMENNRLDKQISVLPVVNSDYMLMGILRLHDVVQAGLT